MAKPQIRLKGHDDEWIQRSLQDCLTISADRNLSNAYGREQVLSVSDDYGVVNQIKHLGRSYAGADMSNYKVVKPHQIIYTKSPLKQKPYGIIKANQNEEGIVSVLYAVYNALPGVCSDFIDRYFSPYYRTNNYLRPLINKGAKNTINITDEGALNGCLFMPLLPEQEKIADYFQSLDELIKASAKRIDSLKQMKAACLQSMFPQLGETAPKVRFKGFTGDWEIVKLSDISKKITQKNRNMEYKITLTNSAEYGVINQLDFFDHDIANSDNISGYFIVEPGDFVYNPRISTSAPVGPINRNKLGYAGVMSPLYYVFRVKGIDHDYLECFFKTNLWHKFMKDNGNSGARFDRLSITDDVFVQMPIIHPKDPKEQQQIASFFSELDSQIHLHEQKLAKLKQIKASCLDKMFV